MITSMEPCPVCGGRKWRSFYVLEQVVAVPRNIGVDLWIDHHGLAASMQSCPDIDICTRCECIVSASGIFSQRGEP